MYHPTYTPSYQTPYHYMPSSLPDLEPQSILRRPSISNSSHRSSRSSARRVSFADDPGRNRRRHNSLPPRSRSLSDSESSRRFASPPRRSSRSSRHHADAEFQAADRRRAERRDRDRAIEEMNRTERREAKEAVRRKALRKAEKDEKRRRKARKDRERDAADLARKLSAARVSSRSKSSSHTTSTPFSVINGVDYDIPRSGHRRHHHHRQRSSKKHYA